MPNGDPGSDTCAGQDGQSRSAHPSTRGRLRTRGAGDVRGIYGGLLSIRPRISRRRSPRGKPGEASHARQTLVRHLSTVGRQPSRKGKHTRNSLLAVALERI